MAQAGLRYFNKLVTKVPLAPKTRLMKLNGIARPVIRLDSDIFLSSTISTGRRSIWHLSNKALIKKPTCCCSLHTEGDREFAEFLKEEISEETRHTVPERTELVGFKIENTTGAEFVLVKEDGGETIRIKANVNASMDDDSESSADPDAEPQMVCRPSMDVYITKASVDKTLVVRCEFPQPDIHEEPQTQPAAYEDTIIINEITLLPKGQEVSEQSFCVAGSVMDADFYDRLLSLLEDRGIDGNFCDQFVNYATDYEHIAYIRFLKEIKAFAESK